MSTKRRFKAKHAGVSLGYMSFFTKAVTRALKLYPDKLYDGWRL
jgi:2-oxoglutarate dehydrogenase E2 component (dihydrolipoamide succinyltransferase)